MAKTIKIGLECKTVSGKKVCCLVLPRSKAVKGLDVVKFEKDDSPDWKPADKIAVRAIAKTPFHRREYPRAKSHQMRVQPQRLDGDYWIEITTNRDRGCVYKNGPRMIIRKSG